MESPWYRVLTAAADLVILNLLTLVACLPLVTAGAAFTALARVTGDMVREDEGYLLRNWWAAFRSNCVGSLAWWLPILGLGALGCFEYWQLGHLTQSATPTSGFTVLTVVSGLILAGLVLLGAVLFWLAPLQAYFADGPARQVLNAVLLAVGHLPRTLAALAVPALGTAIFMLVPQTRGACLWFAVLLGFSFPAYLAALAQKSPLDRLLSTD